MTLTQLQYVLEVAREKNFQRAAKKCFVTQPTLSMQIQKLEDELGAVLFDRSKKPVEPTPIGKRIALQAQVILAEEKRIREIVAEEKAEVRGQLRLAVIPTLSPYLLPLFLGSFFKKFPAIDLVITESQTETILRDLREDRIDAGILVTPLGAAGIIEDPLFEEAFVAYLSAKHRLLAADKVGEKDLALDEAWLLDEGHCFRDQAIELCRRARGPERKKRAGLTLASGNLETLRRLVDSYEGATLLPELATLGLSGEEKRRLRAFRDPVPMREVSLVYSRALLKQPLIQAVAGVVRASLPKGLTRSPKKRHIVKLPHYG